MTSKMALMTAVDDDNQDEFDVDDQPDRIPNGGGGY